jgi:hypothetical protein
VSSNAAISSGIRSAQKVRTRLRIAVTRPPRVLLFSKAVVPAVSVYPDTDTIGVWPDDDTEYYFKRDTAVSRDA